MTLRELEAIQTEPGFIDYPLSMPIMDDESKIIVVFWNGDEKECVLRSGLLQEVDTLKVFSPIAPNVREFRRAA